jgi:multiple sugar transport system substrate-binding protein
MRGARVTLAAGLAALAASCSSGGAAGGGTVTSLGGTGPITFATGKVDTASYLPGLLEEWNRAHPRQRVTLIPLPDDSDDQLAQLSANLQTRSTPYDVMSLDVVWTAEFAANGWIVPLNPGLFPIADFLPPAVSTARYRGQLYAVPFTSNAELLYYRKDILARAGAQPPRTWAQLASLAATVAPRYGLGGYAGQFLSYEGLTVNFAEAVQSAGGSILSAGGTRITLDSAQGRAGLAFLVDGFRQGWIPGAALSYDEEASRKAFERGKLLFLDNWPYVYGLANTPGQGNVVAGRFAVTALPGRAGPGSSSLGGADLAISAYSRHQRTALAFIRFLTSAASERHVLVAGSLPPVWASLYGDPSLVRRFPYLPVLKAAILSARPRPESPDYSQLSLAISSSVHRELAVRGPVGPAIRALSAELGSILKNG